MLFEQACNQEFFWTEEVSRNKATSRNISATANKQKALWRKILCFFHLGTPKTALLMRNFFIDPRNLSISPPQQTEPALSISKKEQRRSPHPPW